MANILLHAAEESITLTAQAAARLLDAGDGDAALLYLALLRHHGTVPPRSLAGELRWEKTRIESAEQTLRKLRLIAEEAAPQLPEPADEPPVYRQSDIVRRLDAEDAFPKLVREVEQKLGKKLTTPDVGVLLGLHDYVGLPADVIYLLVNHCTERITRRHGEGRRPTLRQIEKEGYAWARMGIDTQTAAAEYLKTYASRQQDVPRYMRALQLGDRLPVAAEEKYLAEWQSWGFAPEAVALAYEKTVLNVHEFKWPYCNGILKNWHKNNLHTVEEIEQGDRPAAATQKTAPTRRGSEEMRKHVQQLQQMRKNRG